MYNRLCSLENLELAFQRARKRKTLKWYVIEFEKNLKDNLMQLQQELRSFDYIPFPLKTFIVRDPKTRKISKSHFRDRVVHHALCNIIEPIFEKGFIYSYSKGKSGLAATNRYHIGIALETYKTFHTKIDVDFVESAKSLEKKGELFYYPIGRLFIGKLITFIDRKEFKDIYDISRMISKLDLEVFKGNRNVAKLIDDAIKAIKNEDIVPLYKKAFRNVDLKFKSLKESEIEIFVQKLIRDLRILKNKIS